MASNASGGVTAKMISPQSLSVATAATNMVGQEGNLFRFTIGHSIAMTLVLCVLTYLQAGPLSFMLPESIGRLLPKAVHEPKGAFLREGSFFHALPAARKGR